MTAVSANRIDSLLILADTYSSPRGRVNAETQSTAAKWSYVLRPQFLIGLILGAVFLAAAFALPMFLPSTNRAQASATDKLNQAHRALKEYDPTLPGAMPEDTAAGLREADMEQLAKRAETQLNAIQSNASQAVNRWRQRADANNVPFDAPNISLSASTLDQKIEKFEQVRQANEKTLQDAMKYVSEAKDAAEDHPAPAHLEGLVAYLQAAQKASQAQAERRDMIASLHDAELLGYDWRVASDRVAAAESLHESLSSDLSEAIDELATRRASAVAERDELAGEITARAEQVATLTSEIKTLQNDLITMENHRQQNGGKSPDFANRYQQMRERVGELQQQLQIAQFGGLEGATFSDEDNAQEATVEGGDPVTPLQTLKQRHAGLVELVQRIDDATKVLQQEIADTADEREAVKTEIAALRETSSNLQQQVSAKLSAAKEKSEAAQQLEESALQNANRAISAFGAATRAATAWKNAARDAQSKYDSDRKNERLSLIVNDKSAEMLGNNAQLEAKLLVAKVEQHRADALDVLASATDALTKLECPVAVDFGAVSERLAESRENARKLLDEIAAGYKNSLASQMPAASAPWSTVNAAGAQFRLAMLDEASADTYRAQGIQSLDEALAGLGNPASIASIRGFFAAVPGAGSATQVPAPTTQPPAETQPAAEGLFDDSGDDDDLFGDGE